MVIADFYEKIGDRVIASPISRQTENCFYFSFYAHSQYGKIKDQPFGVAGLLNIM